MLLGSNAWRSKSWVLCACRGSCQPEISQDEILQHWRKFLQTGSGPLGAPCNQCNCRKSGRKGKNYLLELYERQDNLLFLQGENSIARSGVTLAKRHLPRWLEQRAFSSSDRLFRCQERLTEWLLPYQAPHIAAWKSTQHSFVCPTWSSNGKLQAFLQYDELDWYGEVFRSYWWNKLLQYARPKLVDGHL